MNNLFKLEKQFNSYIIMQNFPKEDFEAALKEPKKVRTQLAKFIKQYQTGNYHWIFQSLNILYQIIKGGSSVELNKKLAASFALKVLFDTAEIAIINWVQAFFLAQLQKIVQVCIQDNQASQYFVKIGYNKDIPDLAKYSYSYTKIIAELVEVAASVKPHRLYEAEQLEQQSEYSRVLKSLIKKGYKHSQKMSFFKQDAIKKVIQQFQAKLQHFNSQIYQQFFQLKLQEYLSKGKDEKVLDIFKVYESGDLCVTSSAIQICKDALIRCNSIKSMKNALILLDDLMICSDYQTFYSLNNQNGLKTILKDIFQNKNGDYTINRGKFLFKNAPQNQQQKRNFYIFFLQCLQRWAQFYPTDNRNKSSVLKTFYIQLKGKVQYPHNKNLKQDKQKFSKNKKHNLERNKKLASEIQHQDPQINIEQFKFSSSTDINNKSSQASKKQIASQVKLQEQKEKNESKREIQKKDTQKKLIQSQQSLPVNSRQKQTPQHPPSKFQKNQQFSYQGIKQTILFSKQTLNNLPLQQEEYQTNLAILKQFVNTIDNRLQNAQIEEQSQFNEITQEAFTLSDQINKALQVSKKFQNRDSNFFQFSQQLKSKVIKSKAPKIEEPSIKLNVKYQDSESITLNNQNKVQYTKQMIQEARSNPKIESTVLQKNQQQQDTPVKRIRMDNNAQNSQTNKSRQNFDDTSLIQSKIKQAQHSSKYQQQNKAEFILSQKNGQKHHKIENGSNPHHSMKKVQKYQPISQSRKSYKKIQYIHTDHHNNSIQHSQVRKVQNKILQNSYKRHDYDFQNIAPLQEDVQSNLSAHKPKQFKSLGQYKFQSQNKIPSKQMIKFQKPDILADQQLSLSNIRSNLQKSSVNQYSPEKYQKLSRQVQHSSKMRSSNASHQHNIEEQYNSELLHDQMHVPDYQPLQQSFHDIGEIQQRVKRNPVPSFKKCFDADKYILPQDKKTKIYWLQNDTSNLLRPVSRKQRLKSSKISVPQILEQRNKKYMAQIKHLQDQKNQKIKQLLYKVKNLQSQTVTMKHKITVQDQQIRSMRSNSEYDKQSQGKRNYIEDQQNIILNKFSLGTPSKMMTPQNKHFFDQSKTKSMFLDPAGKLISFKNYKTYFSEFTHQKQKKALLKNKQLLQKDKFLEIGSMGRRQGQNLIIIFYVTSEKDLQGLTWTTQNPGLIISCQPNQVPYIRAKKQEKIYLTIKIDQLPFKLPSITFYYKIQHQFLSQNINIPCGFHKFVHIKQLEDQTLKKYFSNTDNIIRGEQVPYSKRILKNYEVLRQYFPNLSLINKGEPNLQGQISYGGLASYKALAFPVKISIKPNQFLYVQSIAQEKGLQMDHAIEFYICLLTHLLMKQIQL